VRGDRGEDGVLVTRQAGPRGGKGVRGGCLVGPNNLRQAEAGWMRYSTGWQAVIFSVYPIVSVRVQNATLH